MRIAIDARMIKPGTMHGIARYVFHLIAGLMDILGQEDKLFILVNKNSPLINKEWPPFVVLLTVRSPWISFREQIELPYLLMKNKVDLFHAPSFVAPIFCPCTMVMTIHDLNHLVLPQFYTPIHFFYYQFFVKRCIQKSKFLLTVSNFSKSEIITHLQVAANKIFVTYNGVSSSYKPISDLVQGEYIRDLYELPDDFILCVSNNKPHKNLHQLVRAYCFSQIQVPLVLACEVDSKLIEIAENYGKKHLIFFSRFIAEDHLPTIYSLARLFVYPSTYEGFGLPPLEALSCGAPVLVSKTASLPEILGDNAYFVDPYNFHEMAFGLEKALTHDINASKDLRINYAKKFSWRKMATETLEVYQLATSKTK